MDRVHVVPASLPAESSRRVHHLRDWYMSVDLYTRLDAARERRYPKSSTREFALWLLATALTEYEAQEQTAAAKDTLDALAPKRLIAAPPKHQTIVRE